MKGTQLRLLRALRETHETQEWLVFCADLVSQIAALFTVEDGDLGDRGRAE